jgi:glycosyltransferase involved in cell wall biosynthesis
VAAARQWRAPVKILLLAPHPFFAERGTPIAVRSAVAALCRSGRQVDLLTFHEGQDIEIPGMRLFRIAAPPGVTNVPIGFSLKKVVCDLWLAVAAFRLLVRERYDVVHAVEESVFLALVGRLFRRFRLVYDMDSLMMDQIVEKWPRVRPLLPLMRWFETQAIRRSDLVLAVCPSIAERAAQSVSPERVHVLPDIAFALEPGGGQVDILRDYCRKPGPIALYVGNLERYQGVDLMLDAFAAIEESRRCNLVVIGGAPDAVAGYRAIAEARGLSDSCHFLGLRPMEDLGGYLSQADILLSPRLTGVNTPMKVYSYMAAGRAILATDILSHTQILDGECALLAAPDASAMAAGLLRLSEDADLRRRLGARAAAKARDLYSQAAFEARIDRAYAMLTTGG